MAEPHVSMTSSEASTIYRRVGGDGLALWVVLANEVIGQGQCLASKRYLADKLGISTSSIKRYSKALEDASLIKVAEHQEGGYTVCNRYEVFRVDGSQIQGVVGADLSLIRVRVGPKLMSELHLIRSRRDPNLGSGLDLGAGLKPGGVPPQGKTRAYVRMPARLSSSIVDDRISPPPRAYASPVGKKQGEEPLVQVPLLTGYPLLQTDTADALAFMSEIGFTVEEIAKEVVMYTPGALNTAAERTRRTMLKGGRCDDVRAYMFSIANKYNCPDEAPIRTLTPRVMETAAKMEAEGSLAGWAIKDGRIKLVRKSANTPG